MKMVQVLNKDIIQHNLPKVGTLKDGSTISGYHLLDEETLKEEGWLPLEDTQPTYDKETQYLMSDGYEMLEDRVIVKYRVEDIPAMEDIPQEPSEIDILRAEKELLAKSVYDLTSIVEMILLGGIEE